MGTSNIRQLIAVAAVGLLCTLSGCAVIEKGFSEPARVSVKSSGYLTTSGAHQLFSEDPFENIFLPDLLDPEHKRCTGASDCAPRIDNLEMAFRYFYDAGYGDKHEQRLRRNRVQDRILAASEQRCNAYKTYLLRAESTQAAAFGSLTTLLSGAGAIVTGESSARLLSGLAGISSGVGAEFKQAFFANVAARIIVPALDKKRREILAEMTSRHADDIDTYTVERAIQDADRFHGACTLASGLDEASLAINPGLKAIGITLADWHNVKTLANPQATEEVITKAITNLTRGYAGEAKPAAEADVANVYWSQFNGISTAFDNLIARLGAVNQEVVAKLNNTAPAPTDEEKTRYKNQLQMLKSLIEGTTSAKGQVMEKTLQGARERFVNLEEQLNKAKKAYLTSEPAQKTVKVIELSDAHGRLNTEIDKFRHCGNRLVGDIANLLSALQAGASQAQGLAGFESQVNPLGNAFKTYGCVYDAPASVGQQIRPAP